MGGEITPDKLLHNVMETLSGGDGGTSRQNSGSFLHKETPNSDTSKFSKLFGRQKPVHHVLGGGTSADVLLWRNKKISGSVISGFTAVWVLFEWLNYHFLQLFCFAVVLGMLGQFVLSNASAIFKRSPPKVPRLLLPDNLFVNIAIFIGAELNRGLGFLQDVACGGNIKQFLVVVASLWAAAVVGSWCNFLTVVYIGFVAAHTLPVLYEKYDDQIDAIVYYILGQLQNKYRDFDASVLSRIPRREYNAKKYE
ncbi:hypothetical protein DCAR_0622985 [Daucus carota subsp. sativus]|uniref:Reticulon-like protein n=1 Tax=Daucus carota subsp. sativus TaxID=79200 RepID=A0A161YAS9_DAUCS|nr:PREDICTED: reticulon-like protein B8 [Daucus carota subsp. sativus]XP_017257174.1 PREDICTED: reticulon-like protein B8 [Daucus carota subsp. sativus]WOH03586.1 hypothetical protein DCAR_0622985 [Daucus carota subsp. sativus]